MKNLLIASLTLMVIALNSSVSEPSVAYGVRAFGLDVAENANTRYFYISYPFDMGYLSVGDIDPEGQAISIISEYNNSYSKWVSTSFLPDIGWVTNFNIKKGGAYSVYAHSDNAKSLGFAGKYELLPPYNLTSLSGQFYYKGLNFIMMPQEKYSLNTAVKLGNDMIKCDMISKRHYLTNEQLSAYYDTLSFVWDSDFPMNVTDPFFVNVRSSQIWPGGSTKNIKGTGGDGKSGHFAVNDPMPVYYSVQDNKGKSYSFGSVDAKNSTVKFKAWITGRENEVLTHEDYGCGFEQIGDVFSAVYINLGNFDSPWAVGDEVNFLVTDEGNDKSFVAEGKGSYKLAVGNGPVFRGFEPLLAGSGSPIIIDSPAGNEEIVPYTTELFQNYPNPFNPVTTIKYSLEKDCTASLKVYNQVGQVVSILADGKMERGFHKAEFRSDKLSGGIYFYKLDAAGKVIVKKMVMVK
jgi:hypothetical protein